MSFGNSSCLARGCKLVPPMLHRWTSQIWTIGGSGQCIATCRDLTCSSRFFASDPLSLWVTCSFSSVEQCGRLFGNWWRWDIDFVECCLHHDLNSASICCWFVSYVAIHLWDRVCAMSVPCRASYFGAGYSQRAYHSQAQEKALVEGKGAAGDGAGNVLEGIFKEILTGCTIPLLHHEYYVLSALVFIFVYYIYIYGVASKFGYGSARGDPDLWIGLDHLRFGMDRGYGSGVWIGLWVQGMDRGFTFWLTAIYSYLCMLWLFQMMRPLSKLSHWIPYLWVEYDPTFRRSDWQSTVTSPEFYRQVRREVEEMTRRLAPKDVEGNVPTQNLIPHDLSGSNVLLYKIHGVFTCFYKNGSFWSSDFNSLKCLFRNSH